MYIYVMFLYKLCLYNILQKFYSFVRWKYRIRFKRETALENRTMIQGFKIPWIAEIYEQSPAIRDPFFSEQFLYYGIFMLSPGCVGSHGYLYITQLQEIEISQKIMTEIEYHAVIFQIV